MKHKKLKKECEKKTGHIRKSVEQYILYGDAEKIHELRVAFKKLRAFTRLIQWEQKLYGKDPLKKMKELYNVAGSYRDLRLHYEAVDKHFKNTGITSAVYLDMLSVRIDLLKKRLLSLAGAFSFDGFLTKYTGCLPGTLSKRTVRKFIAAQEKNINKYLQKRPANKNIHELRKLLKDISYIMGYLGSKDNKKQLKAAEKNIHDTTDLLGDFVDSFTMLGHLRYISIAKIPVKEKNSLLRLKKEWEHKRAGLREKINGQIYTYKGQRLPMLVAIN